MAQIDAAVHPGGDLRGHTVLVTGATGPRIASGICDALHRAGARLLVNGLVEDEVRLTVARYPGSLGLVGDVADQRDVARMFEEAHAAVGALDGLVNNAGIGLVAPVVEVAEAQFDRLFDVDIRGVWLMSQAFARSVIARNATGAIVNVSSVHAGQTIRQFGAYASAKAAVEGLTRGLAVDLGQAGIRCNAIAPGYVGASPDLAPAQGSGQSMTWQSEHAGEQALSEAVLPIDCGWAVEFLLSPRSRSVTGQVLCVDAGLSTRLYNAATTGRILGERADAPGDRADLRRREAR